jgi:hypothetical protein
MPSFGAHVLHRSHVPWETEHGPHLLARGTTHLPYAEPKFLVERAL